MNRRPFDCSPCKGVLWMDEILHHCKTVGNHCLLVFIGGSSFQGFLGGAKWVSSIHSRMCSRCLLWDVALSVGLVVSEGVSGVSIDPQELGLETRPFGNTNPSHRAPSQSMGNLNMGSLPRSGVPLKNSTRTREQAQRIQR